MLGYKRPKLRKAEHLAFRVVCLYQTIAIEEGCLAAVQDYLLLLITHRRHEPQGHPPSPQFLGVTVTVEVGQVVARVGVAQAAALRVEDSVEAGYEHVL